MEELLYLYDSMDRRIKPLSRCGEKFGFYCCGPTVYSYAHIGNFRTFLAADLLYRVLILGGYEPFYVRNLTDVDDKTIAGSQKDGITLTQFTRHWEDVFHRDCVELNLLSPNVEPRAADHIVEQINLIQQLISKGHAYVRDGSVYFAIASWPSYGRLSRIENQELLAAGVTVDDKEAQEDFALWKASKPSDGENFWKSPWGNGRPGWHIECSAMALKYLGKNFAIHGGGIDLCFPHHENEIAQTEAAMGCNLAQLWFHVAHLRVSGEKMSKSLGNLYTVEDIRKTGYLPLELRYALLAGHYRQPLNFTIESLHSSRKALERIGRFCQKLGDVAVANVEMAKEFSRLSSIWKILLQDLNTPEAIGKMFERINGFSWDGLSRDEAVQELSEWQRLFFAFGLESCLASRPIRSIPSEIKEMAEERLRARRRRDFQRADHLREKLEIQGWQVEDFADGYRLY
ncbi:MAG: cysteine--tRNA ligase [Puniceicoccales bacterium]|jgi:cysteinyl-tRNA synthetase|nr:cysteine--tRNA ligase [Puniceicoccales bacterium]